MTEHGHRVFLFLSTITVVIVSTSVPTLHHHHYNHPANSPYSYYSHRHSQPIFYSRQFARYDEDQIPISPRIIRPFYYFVKEQPDGHRHDDDGGEVQGSSGESVERSGFVESNEEEKLIDEVGAPVNLDNYRVDPLVTVSHDRIGSSASSSVESGESDFNRNSTANSKLILPADFEAKFAQVWPPASSKSDEENDDDDDETAFPPRRLSPYRRPDWPESDSESEGEYKFYGDPAILDPANGHFSNSDRVRFILPVEYHDTSHLTYSTKERTKKPWDETSLSYEDYVSQMKRARRDPFDPYGPSDPFDLDAHFAKTRYDEYGDGHDGDGWGLTDDEILHSKGYKKYRKKVGKAAKFAYKGLKIIRWFQKWMEKKVHKFDVVAPH